MRAAGRVVERVVDYGPVEREQVLAGSRARDGEACATPCVGCLNAASAVDHAGLKQYKLRHVAPVQRQVAYLLFVNQTAQGGSGRLDLSRPAVGDYNSLLHAAQGQADVQRCVLSDR